MKYCQIMNYALQSAYSGRVDGGAREQENTHSAGEQISVGSNSFWWGNGVKLVLESYNSLRSWKLLRKNCWKKLDENDENKY